MSEATTLTLTEFLLARIAEDEAVARACKERGWDSDDADAFAESAQQRLELRHIARHDPARVLAECEAKRRIVEEHAVRRDGEDEWCEICWYVSAPAMAPCDTLRALALPYADHPGYREEWRA